MSLDKRRELLRAQGYEVQPSPKPVAPSLREVIGKRLVQFAVATEAKPTPGEAVQQVNDALDDILAALASHAPAAPSEEQLMFPHRERIDEILQDFAITVMANRPSAGSFADQVRADALSRILAIRDAESAPPRYTEAEIREAIAECWRDDLDAIGNIIDLVMLSRHRDAESATPREHHDLCLCRAITHEWRCHKDCPIGGERGDRNASTGPLAHYIASTLAEEADASTGESATGHYICAHCGAKNVQGNHTCTGVVRGIINVGFNRAGN